MRSFTSALAGAAVTAIIVSGSIAIAAIPNSTTKVITGCYLKTSGTLRVVDKQANKTCKTTEIELSWNQQGVKGDTGSQGLPGLTGATGANGLNGSTMSCDNQLAIKQAVPTFTLTAPCVLPPPSTSSRLGAGSGNSCALLAAQTIKCWGYNNVGQLGTGFGLSIISSTPVTVTGGLTAATAISTGGSHSCALLTDTTVKCWGYNADGGLGNLTNTNSNLPATVFGLSGATAIGAGGTHSCALLTDTTVKCWGSNVVGQLGIGTNGVFTNSNSPVTVSGLSGATAVAAGTYHSCALLTDTTVKCWGSNVVGQLGNGATAESNIPVIVSGLSDATAIAVGGFHSCALLVDTTVKCWGMSNYGQLGNGATADSNIPVTVSGLSGATAIAVGGFHSCALLADSTVKCWGANVFGALGNGSNIDFHIPVTVTGISGATAIAAGENHQCALVGSTTIKCWGKNSTGQLGNGTTTDSNTPGNVIGL